MFFFVFSLFISIHEVVCRKLKLFSMNVCRYGFELQRKAILISDVRVRGIGSTNILRCVCLCHPTLSDCI